MKTPDQPPLASRSRSNQHLVCQWPVSQPCAACVGKCHLDIYRHMCQATGPDLSCCIRCKHDGQDCLPVSGRSSSARSRCHGCKAKVTRLLGSSPSARSRAVYLEHDVLHSRVCGTCGWPKPELRCRDEREREAGGFPCDGVPKGSQPGFSSSGGSAER